MTTVESTHLTIQDMLEEKKPAIRQLLPHHVKDVDRFIKSALLAVSRNPELRKCTPASLFTAIVNAAELGLDFTPAKGHAYMIPYKVHGTLEAIFMPGYRGLIDLARRSGVVSKIEARLVYGKDKFEMILGTKPGLKHQPYLGEDRGAVIGAYAVAFFHQNEEPQFEYMRLDEIKSIQARSKAGGSGPWKTDWNEMTRKTVVRRLFKYLPTSVEIDKAVEADNSAAGLIDLEVKSLPEKDGEMTRRLSDRLGTIETNGQENEEKENRDNELED